MLRAMRVSTGDSLLQPRPRDSGCLPSPDHRGPDPQSKLPTRSTYDLVLSLRKYSKLYLHVNDENEEFAVPILKTGVKSATCKLQGQQVICGHEILINS